MSHLGLKIGHEWLISYEKKLIADEDFGISVVQLGKEDGSDGNIIGPVCHRSNATRPKGSQVHVHRWGAVRQSEALRRGSSAAQRHARTGQLHRGVRQGESA